MTEQKEKDKILHIRIPDEMYGKLVDRAERDGLKHSAALRMLIRAYVDGQVGWGMGPSQPSALGEVMR